MLGHKHALWVRQTGGGEVCGERHQRRAVTGALMCPGLDPATVIAIILADLAGIALGMAATLWWATRDFNKIVEELREYRNQRGG